MCASFCVFISCVFPSSLDPCVLPVMHCPDHRQVKVCNIVAMKDFAFICHLCHTYNSTLSNKFARWTSTVHKQSKRTLDCQCLHIISERVILHALACQKS